MWQLLLSAAIAGSAGFLASHFNLFSHQTPISDDEGNDQRGQCSNFPDQSDFIESGCESDFEKQKQDGIFMFSSSGKNWGKNRSGGVVVCRRRSGLYLKKGRTVKNAAYSNSFIDCSAFLGISLGILCMMSVGKAEISKLNLAVDETAKVVQELKAELHKRRLSRSSVDLDSANVPAISSKKVSGHNSEFVIINKLRTQNSDLAIDDGENASSVLTEEPEGGAEDLEMSQLEAELEAELLKLSQVKVSDEKSNESGQLSCGIYPNCGVSPYELNQKLCSLLIEQQGSQIMELESELHSAKSKLHDKEAELQALKNCVRRLTALPLSTVSDDETEVHEEEEHRTDSSDNRIETESE